MSDVVLQIDGRNHYGWTSIGIKRSLESIADSFELALTDRWHGQTQRRRIRAGDECTLSIDGELIITGYVDDVIPEYDARQYSITVAGRSKAADLVDCSYQGSTVYKGKTFTDAAVHICARFGIGIDVDVPVGAAFTQPHKIEPGETAFELLDRLARYRAVRLVSQPNGDLLITRAGLVRTTTPLQLGGNVLSASGSFSLRDRFGEYNVLGQQSGDDTLNGEVAAGSHGQADDTQIKRYRPTVIQADSINNAECDTQAHWHRNAQYGRSQAIVYTVQGWTHAAGLWQPNRLVPVRDEFMHINGDRLVSAVQYILDENGQRCEIQVMPAEAFDLVELPEPADDDAGYL